MHLILERAGLLWFVCALVLGEVIYWFNWSWGEMSTARVLSAPGSPAARCEMFLGKLQLLNEIINQFIYLTCWNKRLSEAGQGTGLACPRCRGVPGGPATGEGQLPQPRPLFCHQPHSSCEQMWKRCEWCCCWEETISAKFVCIFWCKKNYSEPFRKCGLLLCPDWKPCPHGFRRRRGAGLSLLLCNVDLIAGAF